MSLGDSSEDLPRYDIEAPAEWTPFLGWREQSPRWLLVNAGCAVVIVATAALIGVGEAGDAGLFTALVGAIGGMMLSTALDRYRVVKPESGLVGALRGESREPLEEREGYR